jgi:hypothetical protein
MADEVVRLHELSAVHKIDGGIMVWKFIFQTSERRLRFTGYCIKCGHDLTMEYEIAELERTCPTPFDPDSRSELRIPEDIQAPSLADFEPPPGSKPH